MRGGGGGVGGAYLGLARLEASLKFYYSFFLLKNTFYSMILFLCHINVYFYTLIKVTCE